MATSTTSERAAMTGAEGLVVEGGRSWTRLGFGTHECLAVGGVPHASPAQPSSVAQRVLLNRFSSLPLYTALPCGRLLRRCDTASGQSGSPMWMMAMTSQRKMGPYVRAVHNIEWVQEMPNGQSVSYINSAVSITPDHYRSILVSGRRWGRAVGRGRKLARLGSSVILCWGCLGAGVVLRCRD